MIPDTRRSTGRTCSRRGARRVGRSARGRQRSGAAGGMGVACGWAFGWPATAPGEATDAVPAGRATREGGRVASRDRGRRGDGRRDDAKGKGTTKGSARGGRKSAKRRTPEGKRFSGPPCHPGARGRRRRPCSPRVACPPGGPPEGHPRPPVGARRRAFQFQMAQTRQTRRVSTPPPLTARGHDLPWASLRRGPHLAPTPTIRSSEAVTRGRPPTVEPPSYTLGRPRLIRRRLRPRRV